MAVDANGKTIISINGVDNLNLLDYQALPIKHY